MGSINSGTYSYHFPEFGHFDKFAELPNDIINVIISYTKNKPRDLCLVNKYFSINSKQIRINMLYRDYIYHELTDEDIDIMISQYDGARIFQSCKSDRIEKVTHILKPIDIHIYDRQYMLNGIFYIATNGWICKSKLCKRQVEYRLSTKEEINMFLGKIHQTFRFFNADHIRTS